MVDLKTTTINRATKCSRMDRGTLTIHGFEVLDQRTDEQRRIDAFIENLDRQSWEDHTNNKDNT